MGVGECPQGQQVTDDRAEQLLCVADVAGLCRRYAAHLGEPGSGRPVPHDAWSSSASPQSLRCQSAYYPLSTDEAYTIISNLPYPYDVYALLAADTWCRPEELAGLWPEDVDTEQGVIGINAVVVDVNGHLIRETDPDTVKSIREIDLAPYTNTKWPCT